MEIKYSNDFLELYELINENIRHEKNKVVSDVHENRISEIIIFVLSFISIIASFIAPIENSKTMFLVIGIIILLIGIGYMIINEIKIVGIKYRYRKKVMEEFTKDISNDWEYMMNEPISEVYYKKSGFNQNYKSLFSDGFLKAKRNKNLIEIGNISVEKDITNNNRNITIEAFNGIFAHSHINKKVQEIDIMRTNSKNNVKQKMEIAEQKLYMYSEDINKALEIVDNTLIHKIMQFRKELGIDVEIMIYEDEIYFRFFTGNLISVNLFGSDSEKKILYYYYRIIQFIMEFSDEIEKR
ncbi:MAG: hypothetical protein IKG42_06895 [Clostridia bacterium]|nr:hypothetical protein [Clostridia bacterium]